MPDGTSRLLPLRATDSISRDRLSLKPILQRAEMPKGQRFECERRLFRHIDFRPR